MDKYSIRIINDDSSIIKYIIHEFFSFDSMNSSDFLTYDSILYSIDKYVRKNEMMLCELYFEQNVAGKFVLLDGDEILFFGFIKLEDYKHLDPLIHGLIKIADEEEYSIIRGPINMPPLIGGFGILSSKSLINVFDDSVYSEKNNSNKINPALEIFKENMDKVWLNGCKFNNSHYSIHNFEKMGFFKKFEFSLMPFNRISMKKHYDYLVNALEKYKIELKNSFQDIGPAKKIKISKELLSDWSGMWDTSANPLKLIVTNHHILYLPLFNSWMVVELNLKANMENNDEEIDYKIYLEHFTTNIFDDLTVTLMEYAL